MVVVATSIPAVQVAVRLNSLPMEMVCSRLAEQSKQTVGTLPASTPRVVVVVPVDLSVWKVVPS